MLGKAWERGGPGVRRPEEKAGTSRPALLPGVVQWKRAWDTEHLRGRGRGELGALRAPRGRNRTLGASGPGNDSVGVPMRTRLPAPSLHSRRAKTRDTNLVYLA